MYTENLCGLRIAAPSPIQRSKDQSALRFFDSLVILGKLNACDRFFFQ